MSELEHQESLRRRVESHFADPGSLRRFLEDRKAIIGPRADQMIADAEEARALLLDKKTPSLQQMAALEQAIRFQRPAPLCKPDAETPLDPKNVLAPAWEPFQPKLRQLQQIVARIERVDDSQARIGTGSVPLGSGILVAEDILITAGHVVGQLSWGSNILEPGQAVVDFAKYYGQAASARHAVRSVIRIDTDLDLAALRIEPFEEFDHQLFESPRLTGKIAAGSAICTVGYPLEDERNPAGFTSIVFGTRYGVKRAAVGEITDLKPPHFHHDCSTLGGNSGSPVFDLQSGLLCGVHVSGRALMKNRAVYGKALEQFIRSCLDDSSLPLSDEPEFQKKKINISRRNNMKPSKTDVEAFFKALQAADPDIGDEVNTVMDERVSLESVGGGGEEEFLLESIILKTGRPVLDIKGGAAVLNIQEVDSQIWKSRLEDAAGRLAPHIPSVGRIEVANFPDPRFEWLGTGWLIRDNVVVTNRHVAELFARADGENFRFKPGLDGGPVKASIDFLEEFDSEEAFEFPLFKVMHIEEGGGPDLAFLRIEPVNGHDLPAPVPLSAVSARPDDQVAVIGYPARDDFFPNQKLMREIFNDRYDKKRLAPGLITEAGATRVFHDCSTLGGNSGGEVVSLASGEAVALHFAGRMFVKNHAVPVEVVADRLEKVLRKRPSGGESPSAPIQAPKTSSPSGRVINATIPIQVRIELGEISTGDAPITFTATPAPTPAAPVRSDDDEIDLVEARPEDYVDRDGYNPDFLGIEVPHPRLTRNTCDILTYEFENETHQVLTYRHFSVLMSKSRRQCRYSACNISGRLSRRTSRKGWRFDPRIPRESQIMKECYGNAPKFSRGHMTRREDPAWGDEDTSMEGNVDSMHVTNAVPQIQPFNAGIWLRLEDYALDNAREDDMRISVFTGPFFSDEENDEEESTRFGVQIPVKFWKVIAFLHEETGALAATGYTMSQRAFIGEDEFVFGQHESHQRPISEIEARAGISFGPLAEVDGMRDVPESAPTLLTDPGQIHWG